MSDQEHLTKQDPQSKTPTEPDHRQVAPDTDEQAPVTPTAPDARDDDSAVTSSHDPASAPATSVGPPQDEADQRHQRATRLGLIMLGGVMALIVLTWVLFPLIRGGSSQQIEAAEAAIQGLYLSPQRDYLAPSISENQLSQAKATVQGLSGWSGYWLMRDYERAESRYQAIQALNQVYDSDQPLIKGDQVNHQAPLRAEATADAVQALAQNVAIKQVGSQDALGQAVQGLIQEAGQVFDQVAQVQATISGLNLSTSFDREAVARDVSAIQAIEKDVATLSQHTDTQALRDQLKERVKDFAQLLADKATDTNLSQATIDAVWASPSLAEPLTGSAIDYRKLMSLTFDDGPNPEVTEKLLEVLDKHQVKATFFMMGGFVEKYPEIARKVRDAGHQIGNHTYTHPDMAKETDEGVKKQIQYAQEAIEEATGVTPTLYRLPFGSGGERVVKLLKPMTSIVWNVDSEDWKSQDKDAIVEQVLTHLQPKSVLLMHDTHMATVEAIDYLIPIFKEKGYHFVMPQQNDLGYYYY